MRGRRWWLDGKTGVNHSGEKEKGREREKEREKGSSLSLEKSRESNESGATGVFATNIYTSTTLPPLLVRHPFCNAPPSLASPSPRDIAENYLLIMH